MDYGAPGAEADHALHHLSSHNQYNNHHQQSSGSSAYPPFPHPAITPITPSLEQGASNGRGHLSAHPSASPHHGAIHPQHMPHNYYGDMSHSTITPSTPSNAASPRFAAASPRQSRQSHTSYTPTDRSLPSRDVSDETIDAAYAAFILYCNPSFPASIGTSELTKAFRIPPKSDGKSFSTWSLFELLRKLDRGDIKTWTQLALDLGVEPPDTDKGQSTQKVQQYSVRLKVR